MLQHKLSGTAGFSRVVSPYGVTAAQLAYLGRRNPKRVQRYLKRLMDYLIGWSTKDPTLATEASESREFNPRLRLEGLDWPANALTMIGYCRINNFRTLIEQALAQGVPGDILEAGVWRGGASILARAVLAAHGATNRNVILADSFKGLPAPDTQYPEDADSRLHLFTELAVSQQSVESNFARLGLLDDQVKFVPGWFHDTMPELPVDQIAVLRLDADMYESTMEILNSLYDRVSPGGFIIVDDYALLPCRLALERFFEIRGIAPLIIPIDFFGAYFHKPSTGQDSPLLTAGFQRIHGGQIVV